MHEKFMQFAIDEAKKGMNNTFTNPLVGAVITKNNHIITTSAHLEYGNEHAERNAIAQCKFPEELFNSILYVTLEPCTHFGKQPPCAQLIVESGIKTVIIGQLDPNPLVKGKGMAYLKKHGVEVILGVKEKEVKKLNLHYNFLYEKKRPYIILKQSMTLDGKITIDKNMRTSITGKQVWDTVHKERGNYHAILVGSQTILADNPTLLSTKKLKFPPIRIIIDRRGRTLNKNLNIFKNTSSPVWIFTEIIDPIYLPSHVEIIRKPTILIHDVINEITKRNLQSLYVEGGAQIHDSFLENDLWDEIITYLSPKILGGNSLTSFHSNRIVKNCIELNSVEIKKIGRDFRIVGKRREDICLLD